MFTKKFLLIVIAVFAIFFSCKKEDSILGLDVQPENDLLYASFYDDAHCISKTVKDDSLISSLNNLGIYLLGSYADPVFGRSDASIFTNFILKDNITNVNTGTKPQMDSVVLSLVYKIDYYGDTTDQMKVNVHLLTDSINPLTFYSSYNTEPFNPADITESGTGYSFYPMPKCSVNVGGVNVKQQLRIRLNKTFFEDSLLTQDAVNLANSTAMQKIFKGLYITTKNTTVFSPDYGSLLYFLLYDNSTKITFYYHNFTQSSQMLEFTCGGGTGHFNHFDHDFGIANSNLQAQLNTNPAPGDTVYGQKNIFIQSMAGLGANLNFSKLTYLCDSGAIAVAKAELLIPVDQDPQWFGTTYQPPLGLWLKAYKSDGTLESMVDAGTYWFGGSYDATLKVYKFD
ncbi:MAG: DUF4270 family protein, partial [Bacteroidia bacterium]|nr:DUF4270 family protein [Bacteroidia bacterium]